LVLVIESLEAAVRMDGSRYNRFIRASEMTQPQVGCTAPSPSSVTGIVMIACCLRSPNVRSAAIGVDWKQIYRVRRRAIFMRQADIRPGRTYVGAGVYYARTVENVWEDGADVYVRWSVPVANPARGPKAYEKHSEVHICTLRTFARWANHESLQNNPL